MMLLRFSATNHLSLRDTQELSLIAAALKDDTSALIEFAGVPNGQVLPAIAIYGANASGKTNIVEAFHFTVRAVIQSHSQGRPEGGIPRAPFALDPKCNDKPSIFDLDFVVDGVRYHYGFEADNKRFRAEWLYAYPTSRRQMLFERSGQDFEFGRYLRGRNKIIADLTRENSLFLSAAAQNDHKQLIKISRFFRRAEVLGPSLRAAEDSIFSSGDGNIDDRVIDFLGEIGTGVIGYRKRDVELDERAQKFVRMIFSEISPDSDMEPPSKETKIEFAHKALDGSHVYLPIERESRGTRRLTHLLQAAFDALDTGSLLFVDELDTSLHTKACEAVIALFASRQLNPHNAQIITAVHDTNLLRSPLLRRDQIWFTEKNDCGATELYPLSDFRTRQGDNIEKGYLEGRYGAIPFSGDPAKFLELD